MTALAVEKESGLSQRAFSVHWELKDDLRLRAAGVSTLELDREAESLLARFSNAAVSADEQRLHTRPSCPQRSS